jgi:hypothetical protein
MILTEQGEKNLSLCHLVHHKSHTDWPEIGPSMPRRSLCSVKFQCTAISIICYVTLNRTLHLHISPLVQTRNYRCVCDNCARNVNTLWGYHSAAVPVHKLTTVMLSVSQTKSKTNSSNPHPSRLKAPTEHLQNSTYDTLRCSPF